MDHMGEVRRTAQEFRDAKARMRDAMEARNAAIRSARGVRHGTGEIGKCAELTPEQVRRIVDSAPGQATYRPNQQSRGNRKS